jgi:hypothetical protein
MLTGSTGRQCSYPSNLVLRVVPSPNTISTTILQWILTLRRPEYRLARVVAVVTKLSVDCDVIVLVESLGCSLVFTVRLIEMILFDANMINHVL